MRDIMKWVLFFLAGFLISQYVITCNKRNFITECIKTKQVEECNKIYKELNL